MLASVGDHVETDGARLRALGADAMSEGLLSVLRHEGLQFGTGGLVRRMCIAGADEHGRMFRPGVRGGHVDDAEERPLAVGGSTSKGCGTSPVCTQRQKRRSTCRSTVW